MWVLGQDPTHEGAGELSWLRIYTDSRMLAPLVGGLFYSQFVVLKNSMSG